MRALTIVGGDRERPACPRRGRGRDGAPAALDRALLGGPSASPLDGRLVGNAAVLKGAFALALVGGSSLLVAKPHNGFGAAEGERHDG